MKKLLEVLMTYFFTICTGVLLFAFLVFLLKCFFLKCISKAITKQIPSLILSEVSAFSITFYYYLQFNLLRFLQSL